MNEKIDITDIILYLLEHPNTWTTAKLKTMLEELWKQAYHKGCVDTYNNPEADYS